MKRIELFVTGKDSNKWLCLYDTDDPAEEPTLKELDVPPRIIGERTFLPVRVISEALGASAEWVEKDRGVIVRSEEAEIILSIGVPAMFVNGVRVSLDAAPVIVDDRALLPIRFISEALHCKVDWDDGARKVTIVGA